MSLRLGDTAPDFTANTSMGKINFHEWVGDNWCVLYSHPADFTPVCTTELGQTAKLKEEFAKRGCKVIAVSVDSNEHHRDWINDINDTQSTEVNFPIIADEDRHVAELYDMIHPNSDSPATVRSVFIIDANKKIRTTLTYPASTGRNFGEILRVIDSLQLTDNHKVATPVDWVEGQECVILPTITNEDAQSQFPKGWKELRPYLRMTPQPNK